jgi:hypothetical protein
MKANATVTEAAATTVPKEQLMEDLRAVVTDAEELLRATANQTGEGIASAREHIRGVCTMRECVWHRPKPLWLSAPGKRPRPPMSMCMNIPGRQWGIGAGVGVLIGMLIARR